MYSINGQLQYDMQQAVIDPIVKPAKQARSVPVKQIVADLSRTTPDLALNLRSLFTIFPGWSDEELDEESMLADFIRDTAPDEREGNLRALLMACAVDEVRTVCLQLVYSRDELCFHSPSNPTSSPAPSIPAVASRRCCAPWAGFRGQGEQRPCGPTFGAIGRPFLASIEF